MASYAKPCKYCKVTQVVWDDRLPGSNKFKELQSNEQHTQQRCKAVQQSERTGEIQGEVEKTVWDILEVYDKRLKQVEAYSLRLMELEKAVFNNNKDTSSSVKTTTTKVF